jgi:NADP-dependent 3-hydroxy acid dehydrogenase YdfG
MLLLLLLVFRDQAADVGDAAAVSRAVRNSLAWRPIDVLVCNAGLACQGQLDEVDAPRLEYVARTNLLGCVFPLHAALPHLKSRSFQTPCSVVIMGSSASLVTKKKKKTLKSTDLLNR